MSWKSSLVWLGSAVLAGWPVFSAAEERLAAPAPSVRVEFVHPERFSDIDDRLIGSGERRAARLEELREHILRHATGFLASGQSLVIAITEVDMAGRFEPWRRYDVRIVRDVYPPRIDLHFRLTDAAGGILNEGERKLRDPTFLMTTVAYRDDPLRFEKALLDNWLAREFRRG